MHVYVCISNTHYDDNDDIYVYIYIHTKQIKILWQHACTGVQGLSVYACTFNKNYDDDVYIYIYEDIMTVRPKGRAGLSADAYVCVD